MGGSHWEEEEEAVEAVGWWDTGGTPQRHSQKNSAGRLKHPVLSESMPLNPFDYVGKAVQKRFRNYGVYRGRVLELVSVRGTLYFRVSGESVAAEREGREAYVNTGGIECLYCWGARRFVYCGKEKRKQ